MLNKLKIIKTFEIFKLIQLNFVGKKENTPRHAYKNKTDRFNKLYAKYMFHKISWNYLFISIQKSYTSTSKNIPNGGFLAS